MKRRRHPDWFLDILAACIVVGVTILFVALAVMAFGLVLNLGRLAWHLVS